MPKKDASGSILDLKKHKHSMRVSITVFADFECFTKPIQTCQQTPDKSFAKAYQKHEPSGFSYYIVCNGKKLKSVLNTKQTEDENIGAIFVNRLHNDNEQVWTSEVKSIIMTLQDKLTLKN